VNGAHTNWPAQAQTPRVLGCDQTFGVRPVATNVVSGFAHREGLFVESEIIDSNVFTSITERTNWPAQAQTPRVLGYDQIFGMKPVATNVVSEFTYGEGLFFESNAHG
jgi:hypothetical protein